MATDDQGVPSVDGLTGLPNRVSWEAVLAMEEQRSRRYGGEHGLVLVELVGPIDAGLVERTAAAIGAAVREVDFVAVVDRRTFAVLALHCQDLSAFVRRLHYTFDAAGLRSVARFDARSAGPGLQVTWTAMAGEHSRGAAPHYVDFVAPAHFTQN